MAALRDAVERQARTQRGWFDSALLSRQRKDVLASLGEVVYQLALAGELGDLEEFPEVSRLIYDLEDIDAQIEQSEAEIAARSGRRTPREVWGRGPRKAPEPPGEFRVWRPVDPDEPSAEEPPNPEPAPKKPKRRGGRRRRAAREKTGKIEFVQDDTPVEDDSDLADYMHEDDVKPAESGSQDD